MSHLLTNREIKMSEHENEERSSDCCCEFADLEVYSTCASTDQVDDNSQVTVDLDEDKLEEIYNESSISSEYTYDEFKEKVQEEADKAATEAWPKIKEVNDFWLELGSYEQRIIKVRLCIPIGWVRIYICYKP